MNRLLRRLLLIVPLLVGAILSAGSTCQAQTFKPGDLVQVAHLRDWRPGTVISTNARGEVTVEFEFAGRPQRRAFPKSEIRWAYEADALSRGRTWSDASGKFRIKAALLALDDNEVTLRKEDLSEVKVAIDKLSESDQSYLKRLQSEGGPATVRPPEHPPLERFADNRQLGWGRSMAGASDKRQALDPDPIPAYRRMKQGGVGFAPDDFHDHVGTVIPIGGPDVWVLASLENPFKVPTRLLWISLARQKVEGKLLLPLGEKVLDYHAPTRRLLTCNQNAGDTFIDESEVPGAGEPAAALRELAAGGIPGRVPRNSPLKGRAAFSLWEVSPDDKLVKPVVRWEVETNAFTLRGGPWAYLIDGSHVIQRSASHEFVVWDVEQKRSVYRVTQESFFAPDAALSGGRKYLFIPEDKGVRVLESVTGKFLMTLPAPEGSSGVAISEDGRQAAVLNRSQITVWDLTAPDAEPQRHQAEAIGTPFTAKLYWLGDNRLMRDENHRQSLFSFQSRIVLWNYEFDHTAVRNWGRTREIIDGHLVYVASIQERNVRGLAVGAVTLPGPQVDDAEAALDVESLYIVKPGIPVRIEANCGEHSARVQKALAEKVQSAGWRLDPSASIVLSAEMKRGEQQTVTYRMSGGQSGEQSATFTPFISSLHLKVGDSIAWQSGTSTGAPPVMHLSEGQTVQGEINRWQRPQPEFFDNVTLPGRIMDPAKRSGLGTTRVTNRGLIPKGE